MIEILVFLIPLVVIYFIGSAIEASHYKSIRLREIRTRQLPIFVEKQSKLSTDYQEAQLFTGSVVVSVDYFKRFLAKLRNIFGGRVRSYESLLDRARREAILRMKEDAIRWGAKEIINFRFETSTIGGTASDGKALGSVEVLAYGTGLKSLKNL